MRKGMLATLAVAALFGGPGAGAAWADFLCPVVPISEQGYANTNADFATVPNGDRVILPGKAGDSAVSPVSVPDQATNQEGTGSAGGEHAAPGDPGYSPIWNTP